MILFCPNSNRGQVFILAVGEIRVDESFHISNSSYFIWVQMLPLNSYADCSIMVAETNKWLIATEA